MHQKSQMKMTQKYLQIVVCTECPSSPLKIHMGESVTVTNIWSYKHSNQAVTIYLEWKRTNNKCLSRKSQFPRNYPSYDNESFVSFSLKIFFVTF